MSAVDDRLREDMRQAGLFYDGPLVPDGKLHRFRAEGDHAKNSGYVIFPGPRSAGAFWCHKRQIKEKWVDRNSKQLTAAELLALRRKITESEQIRKHEEELRRRKAQKLAAWILSMSKSADPAHPYLVKKGVKPHGDIKQYRGALVIALRDSATVVHTVQFIGADSEKRFLTGGRVEGCSFKIADTGSGPLILCEGLATGLSIYEATGHAVYCAMYCANLLPIAQAVRAKWPERDIIIAADNDAFTTDKDGKLKNPGVNAATESAKAIHARLAVPQFKNTATKPTDFNDLANHEGPDKVKTQIEAATCPPQSEHASKPARGQHGCASLTPSQWFAGKFRSLTDEYGDPVLEEIDKHDIVSARDIGEDFFAATLGSKGCPDAPTVFIPTEEKFYTYSPSEGVFVLQREPALLTRLSSQLLECARACRGGVCDTKTLEFRFRDSASLTGVLKKARGLLAVPHDYFSTNLTEFIPCANGMLRLADKKLLAFSPSYRRRNKLAVPYVPSARCPLFLDTLMHPALEPEDFDLVQRHSGLMLIGENVAQKIMILTGTPGGGKGTYIRVVCGVIGQVNLASLRPQLLGERFELGRFLGKTLLYGADVPDNFLNQRGASVLKSLTGGDPVTLEFKNSNESPVIICKFNVIATCNSRLTVHLEGDTEAWRRRLTIADYHKPKPPKPIADLDQQILTKEASGVLNWMLEGLYKLRADGYQSCFANKQWLIANDVDEEDIGAIEEAAFKLIKLRTLKGLPKIHYVMRELPKICALKDSRKEILKIAGDRYLQHFDRPGMYGTISSGLSDKEGRWQAFIDYSKKYQLHLTGGQQSAVDNLLLESDGHAVFARECLTRDTNGQLTVADCFAAYVEFCTQRGWTALTKNQFGALIGDVVVRRLGVTTRHDIRGDDGKAQRGWRGITTLQNSTAPTGGKVSEVSENRPSDESDALLPLHPEKKSPNPAPTVTVGEVLKPPSPPDEEPVLIKEPV